jgi:hypothetical protein
MPSKTEKQKRFFGAVMGAKKGKAKVTGAAKKAAAKMPEKKIKEFLKKESFDETVNNFLEKFFREGMTVESHCKYAKDGCDCSGCEECKENKLNH